MSLYSVLGVLAILALLGGAFALTVALVPSVLAAWTQLTQTMRRRR